MGNNKPLIVTTDKETAETLKRLGLPLLSESSGQWTFVNDVTKYSAFSENLKVVETNKVTM